MPGVLPHHIDNRYHSNATVPHLPGLSLLLPLDLSPLF
ncbi:UNVERIFIED_CONTAM: hypothetical protein GTU68_047053 [Idotea baltica]|nr:hypothetical protein [Idotea baltica]